jgi:hypothetical protein
MGIQDRKQNIMCWFPCRCLAIAACVDGQCICLYPGLPKLHGRWNIKKMRATKQNADTTGFSARNLGFGSGTWRRGRFERKDIVNLGRKRARRAAGECAGP